SQPSAIELRLVADVPGPTIFEEAETLTEVVAHRVWEERCGKVERHPVYDVLLAGVATLRLQALLNLSLENLDGVECVHAIINQPADGVNLWIEDRRGRNERTVPDIELLFARLDVAERLVRRVVVEAVELGQARERCIGM